MHTTNPSHTLDDKNTTRTQLIQEAQAQQAKRDAEIARLSAVFLKTTRIFNLSFKQRVCFDHN